MDEFTGFYGPGHITDEERQAYEDEMAARYEAYIAERNEPPELEEPPLAPDEIENAEVVKLRGKCAVCGHQLSLGWDDDDPGWCNPRFGGCGNRVRLVR